jgi:hypothetical protein
MLSVEERAALARQRLEIRALPSTDDGAYMKMMESQFEYEDDCDSGPVSELVTCTERITKCHHHTHMLASYMMEQMMLRAVGAEGRMADCDECGKKVLDCWKIEMISEDHG